MVEKRATLAAEYSVIGALLLDPKIAGELFAATRESDFLRAELRTVYTAAREIFNRGRPLDPVTIRAAIGREYEPLLMECMDVCSTASAWKAYAEAMQEQTRVSRLRELADKLTQVRTSEEGRELIAAAMEATAEKQGAEIVTLSQGFDTFTLEQTEKRKFIEYGFSRLDSRLYSDFGDFVVLAGRPSAGKTALALQMATHMGRRAKVGFYSLETTPSKLINRIVSNRAIIDFGRINRREMTPEEWTRLNRLQREITESDIELVHAPGWSVQNILDCARSRRHRIVFIDYLQLLRAPGRDRVTVVTNISMGLHTMAQDQKILVVALSQFSRASEARDGEPSLTDLRESGQIEQDADVVLFLHREDYDDKQSNRILRIAKNKEGEAMDWVNFRFDGDLQTFSRIAPETPAPPAEKPKRERQPPRQVSFWADGGSFQDTPWGKG